MWVCENYGGEVGIKDNRMCETNQLFVESSVLKFLPLTPTSDLLHLKMWWPNRWDWYESIGCIGQIHWHLPRTFLAVLIHTAYRTYNIIWQKEVKAEILVRTWRLSFLWNENNEKYNAPASQIYRRKEWHSGTVETNQKCLLFYESTLKNRLLTKRTFGRETAAKPLQSQNMLEEINLSYWLVRDHEGFETHMSRPQKKGSNAPIIPYVKTP